MTKIAIIGAGIGGLTTALACARLGLSVTLYERARVLAPLGASLSLWPNAMAVLDRLGLGDALRADGAALSRVALREGGGRTLTDCDLSAINAKLGAGVCVPRAVLHEQLRQALPEGILRLGVTLTGITQTRDDVSLNFSNGHSETADLVIAADGVHSTIRAQLWGDGPARYAGYCAALAISQSTPKAVIPGEAAELYGPGGRLGLIPTGHGRCYWFFVRTMPSPAPHAAPINKAEMVRWLAPWPDLMPDLDPDLVPDLLDNTTEEAMVLAPIHDRNGTRHWGKGRVLLLGDALHPFTPNLGQGAGMAIEDGALLASLIACGTPPTALARPYRHLRTSRVNAMARQARMIGQLAQWQGVLAPQLRRGFFGMASESQMARRFEHQFTLPAATRKCLDAAGLVA